MVSVSSLVNTISCDSGGTLLVLMSSEDDCLGRLMMTDLRCLNVTVLRSSGDDFPQNNDGLWRPARSCG